MFIAAKDMTNFTIPWLSWSAKLFLATFQHAHKKAHDQPLYLCSLAHALKLRKKGKGLNVGNSLTQIMEVAVIN